MKWFACAIAGLALSLPAFAQGKQEAVKQEVRCVGGTFEVNEKILCVVDAEFEDYYRTGDNQRTPAPGSLIVLQQEPRHPHIKMSGLALLNSMMEKQFDSSTCDAPRDARLPSSCSWSTSPDGYGWGASFQWSPNDTLWVEFGWQYPQPIEINVDTSMSRIAYQTACSGRPCTATSVTTQSDRHRFTANDFSLGLKYDLASDSEHISILIGAGIQRRYLKFKTVSINADVIDGVTRSSNDAYSLERSEQLRGYSEMDVELYPAGKTRALGVGIAARWLSHGNVQREFHTSSLFDSDIPMGIRTGRFDVTARVVVRF